MKIQLSELLEVEKPLSELINQELPIRIAYHLSKLVKKVGSELKDFYDARDRLIMKLGCENDQGQFSINIEDKTVLEQFHNEINSLVNVEVDLYNFEPISISEFDKVDIKISPIQMATLNKFFKE